MDKAELISRTGQFNKDFSIMPEEYVLLAGCAMVMHGLRKHTQDIDIKVEEHTWKKLRSTGKFQHIERTGADGSALNILDDGTFDIGYGSGFNKLKDQSIEWIDGVQVQSLTAILEFKMMMNRLKDQEDIKVLKEAIRKRM